MTDKKKTASNIRVYSIKDGILKTQKESLILLLNEYRVTAEIIANNLWQNFFTSGEIDKYMSFALDDSKLSKRYQQVCYAQVVGMLKSFIANRKNDFNDCVHRSSLDKDLKHKVNLINNRNLWFKGDDYSLEVINKKTGEVKTTLITKDELKLARKIFKHVLKGFKRPTYKRINLALDSKVFTLSASKTAKHWDYWLNVSSLTPRKLIKIPLKLNQYFNLARGDLKNFVQLNFNEANELTVYLMKDSGQLAYTSKNDSIGLDFGMRNLITTSKGDLIGRNFIDRLREYDNKITALRLANPQFFWKLDAYKIIVKTTRAYIKNELSRCLNWVVKRYAPKEIVVEKLEFRFLHFTRQMNRLVSNCGIGYFYTKLERLSNDYGILITKIHAAYTSRTCSSCGYISATNRKTQSKFKCDCCGKKINADINGARNIENRRSISSIKVFSAKRAVLDILVTAFLANIERHGVVNSNTNTVLYRCPWNLSVIKDNPYFADNLGNREFNQVCSAFSLQG